MPTDAHRRTFLLSGAAACAAGATWADGAQAAEGDELSLDPRLFGLDIPAGRLRPGGGRTFLTSDPAGNPVVARSVASVGLHELVLLPDGQIVIRVPKECAPTQRPFLPLDRETLAKQLLQGPLKDFKVKHTKHYLFVYDATEDFAVVTSRILESMVPGLVEFGRNMQVKTVEPELPLIVIMFRRDADYQAYSHMPPGLVAYYHVLDNRVSMCEESPFAKFNPGLAIEQSLSTIAHEGAHQILHNIGVQQRLSLWPMWLAEGIAEYLAPTTTGRNLRWKGAGQVNDWRMFELERYLKTRAADTADGKVISDVVQAQRLSSTGYAAAWGLTHFLIATKRNDFIKLFSELAKLAPLAESGNLSGAAANRQQFQISFGNDFALLEKQMIGHLSRLDYSSPFAEYPHWVAMVVTMPNRRERREAEVFLSPIDADRWQKECIERQPKELRADAVTNIRRFVNRLEAEQWAGQWRKG